MKTTTKILIARANILKILGDILESWIDKAEQSSLSEETNLLTELGLDSVALLHLILGIEQEFHVKINDHELDSAMFSKAANLINLIEIKLNETHRLT